MNQPRVYICSLSWPSPTPPSPSPPSGSSQCTSPEHPVSCIEPGLVIYFTYNMHVSMLFSQIIPPSPSPTESKSLFFTSVSLLLACIQGHHYHLSKFHIYALIYCIGLFSFWLTSLCTTGSSVFLFFSFIFISWRLITLQCCSRLFYTLTWISHGFTCVPHPEIPSHHPPYPISLGHHSAPALSTCLMHLTWTGDLFRTW